ncbi:tyrosyl-tRNA synthetase [Pedobacter lusitanus]|uniref:Tyrosine--tRNA ligase n=1 Tax=Pedobacter lusitanus TaxID=1503925 RepID=A0A0D0GTU1_9SPHI|nr:tyrosine--tRNA ligase [Pedobacter lusitanus]KIO77811.1 tyrosyl-tRNA synthetase [Pedobacter lusitanus]
MKTIKENVEIILPENGLEQKFKLAGQENRKLIIKLGFDPTAPDLHLGHAVVLKKLKTFQDLGHRIVIVIGNFTARIGDPTGKNKSRPPLSREAIMLNAQTYVNQLSKILDINRCEITYNAEWLEKLNLSDTILLLSKITVAQIMHRTDFSKRFQQNLPIAMHELIYPVLQGLDSVKIQADIEMGGTDQLFNCTMGRQLQEAEGFPPQVVMCMPLLKGLDGKEKMSKSLNNIIGLTDEPNEIFGKMMSVPDEVIPEYLELVTDFDQTTRQHWMEKLNNGENPMILKKIIAGNVIRQYHTEQDAINAAQYFAQQFQSRSFQEKNFTVVSIAELIRDHDQLNLLDLCAFLRKDESRSALKRLIDSGGVAVNDHKMTDSYGLLKISGPVRIRMGKRGYFEVTPF